MGVDMIVAVVVVAVVIVHLSIATTGQSRCDQWLIPYFSCGLVYG